MGTRFKYGMKGTDAFRALNEMDDDVQVAKGAAVSALASADAAEGSAQAAAASAAEALDHKNAAGTSAVAGAASASSAADQAGIATAKAGEASGSAAAAAGSASTATAQAAIATAKAGEAQAAVVNVAAAEAAASSAQTALAGTTSAATQAANARDQAIAAWQASTAQSEQLAAMSQSIHSGAIVDAFLYDTAKDSDGGAWRKRTIHTSWYNETIYGTWRGQRANEAACRAVSGATTNDYYQNTTDGKFYALNAGAGQVEVFRGNKREFPALAGIVAETARVVVYDLSNGSMWRVFAPTALATSRDFWRSTRLVSAVAALNGKLYFTTQPSADAGLHIVDFVADRAERITSSSSASSGTVTPLTSISTTPVAATTTYIVNQAANDVAVCVLPGAPVDPATGLPVPTIAVATAGGVSVIKDSGTVVNSSSTFNCTDVAIADDTLFFLNSSNGQVRFRRGLAAGLPSAWADSTYTSALIPAIIGWTDSVAAGRGIVVGGSTVKGMTVFKENPSDHTKGMVAYITNAYNSGWQVGDSRGAWLADTVAETIAASGELVTNGMFDTDTAGWTAFGSAILSVVGGAMRVTNDPTTPAYGGASFAVPTVIGKTYQYSWTCPGGTSSAPFASVGTVVAGTTLGTSTAASGTITFTATTATTYVNVQVTGNIASQYRDYDNISVKLASPDRSVKNNGLIINGTLTKAAVATGAQLVGFSGFSASNYLEQPYNSNLDFGTGDFCVMGWANLTNDPYTLFDRGTAGAGRIAMYSSSTNLIIVCGATGALLDTGIARPTGLNFFSLVRLAGVLYLYINGRSVWSSANTDNVSNALATLRYGLRYTGDNAATGATLALWRASATAPSADQIAHIYRTELAMFQPNAKVAIDGTSTAVTALGYDEDTELLHVGTSWGRSAFKDLVRVESEATQVGSITSLSASTGAIITGGTSARIYQPALLLRDELKRQAAARRALGKEPVFLDFDSTSPTVDFNLPKGYTIKAVYVAGVLKRLGATKDYTVLNDGFKETVRFGVTPGTAWVSLMCVRSN